MFWLSLLWLVLGGLLGLIATAARLQPAAWRTRNWLRMGSVGAITALCGGWIGTWLLSKYFATPTAIWLAIVGLVTLPYALDWLSPRIRSWIAARQQHPEQSK